MEISVITTLVLTAIIIICFCVIVAKKPVFEIYNDMIVINDLMYKAMIPNYTIKSIELADNLPKITCRMNGYGGLKRWKGFFGLKHDVNNNAILFLEDHKHGPCIRIKTVKELIVINLEAAEQTRQFYDEMMKTLKFVKEEELVPYKAVPAKRSWIIVAILVAVVTLVSLIPLL